MVITIDDVLLLILEVTIAVGNSLHELPVGNRLVVALDSLSLAARRLLCEKLEETVPVPTKLDHQLPRDPFMAGDGKLDFGPHRVCCTALLRAIPLPDPCNVPVLDLLDDLWRFRARSSAATTVLPHKRMAASSGSQIRVEAVPDEAAVVAGDEEARG